MALRAVAASRGLRRFFSTSTLPSSNPLPTADSALQKPEAEPSTDLFISEDLEMHRRMKAIGDLIQLHSPDLVCFQEVTPNIYDYFATPAGGRGRFVIFLLRCNNG
ncbi:hypothetical protein QYF36_018298 [Acer negundo]|nr:hypothetical protein QYF36_018298 [Acer negundo]